MLRTSRTYRRGVLALTWLERDDTQHMPWRRQEALEAERRRWAGWE